IGAQVEEFRDAHIRERLAPDRQASAALFLENDFPVLVPHCQQVAVITPVEEALAWRLLLDAVQEWQQVNPVEMNLENLVADLVPVLYFLHEISLAAGGGECRYEILERSHVIDHLSGFDHTGPAHHARHTPAAFPVGILLPTKRSRATIGPRHHFGAVVGGD